MKWLTMLGIPIVLAACATEPMYEVPSNQRVVDYIKTTQLTEVNIVRKGNSDGWQYLNDRYVIYKGIHDYLFEFRANSGVLADNSWIPADYIHDHRNLRARVDTIRGCIVEKIYPLTRDQRTELRHLGGARKQRN